MSRQTVFNLLCFFRNLLCSACQYFVATAIIVEKLWIDASPLHNALVDVDVVLVDVMLVVVDVVNI